MVVPYISGNNPGISQTVYLIAHRVVAVTDVNRVYRVICPSGIG
ncbi:MAG: hypothetical protein WC295_02085 [Methanoregula sp.]